LAKRRQVKKTASQPVSALETTTVVQPQFGNRTRRVAAVETIAERSAEYVTARISYTPSLRALTHAADELSCQFGVEIFDKMALDGEFSAALDTLVYAACANEISLSNPLPENHADYAKAELVLEFFKWANERHPALTTEALTQIARSMLLYGNSIAELIFSIVDDGDYTGSEVLSGIRPRLIKETSLIVDDFDNVVGIYPLNQVSLTLPIGTYIPLKYSEGGEVVAGRNKLKGILPRTKFLLTTWNKQGNDPRGRAWGLAAYNLWWLKQQVINEFLCWIAQFARPSLWGETAPDAQAVCVVDPTTGAETTISPTDQMLSVLQNIRNGSVAAVPHGAAIHTLEMTGSGEIFLAALEKIDNMLTRSLMKQHLATGEGQHQARAAAETHQDILGLMIAVVRRVIAESLRRDIFHQLTIINFGSDAGHLTPTVSLGDGDGFPVTVSEAAQLTGQKAADVIDMRELVKQMGLPLMSEEAQAEAEEKRLEITRANANKAKVSNDEN